MHPPPHVLNLRTAQRGLARQASRAICDAVIENDLRFNSVTSEEKSPARARAPASTGGGTGGNKEKSEVESPQRSGESPTKRLKPTPTNKTAQSQPDADPHKEADPAPVTPVLTPKERLYPELTESLVTGLICPILDREAGGSIADRDCGKPN